MCYIWLFYLIIIACSFHETKENHVFCRNNHIYIICISLQINVKQEFCNKCRQMCPIIEAIIPIIPITPLLFIQYNFYLWPTFNQLLYIWLYWICVCTVRSSNSHKKTHFSYLVNFGPEKVPMSKNVDCSVPRFWKRSYQQSCYINLYKFW